MHPYLFNLSLFNYRSNIANDLFVPSTAFFRPAFPHEAQFRLILFSCSQPTYSRGEKTIGNS